MPENVSISMPDELVRPIIEAKISAAIVAALGDSDALLERAVSLALQQKVGANGQPERYSSDNKYTFVEAMCSTAIQEYARKAIATWLESSKAKIEGAIKKHLDKKTNEIAASIVVAMVERTKVNASFEVKAKFSRYDE